MRLIVDFLVDPDNITKFDCTEQELQLVLLFWICAAGKKASTAARNLDRMLSHGRETFGTDEPFEIIRRFGDDLAESMRIHGIGCYNNKSKSMLDLASRSLDLKNCSVFELESVHGIGPKTARCFLMHSRKDARFAGLDTHALKYMREQGLDVPKSTPSGKKYLELEAKFLKMADESGKTVAEFDLEIWRHYSSGGKSFVGN
jgi:thermostable 8-oxoguanine DNA glycosylase